MAVYKTPKNLTLGYSPSVKPTVPVVVDTNHFLFQGSNAHQFDVSALFFQGSHQNYSGTTNTKALTGDAYITHEGYHYGTANSTAQYDGFLDLDNYGGQVAIFATCIVTSTNNYDFLCNTDISGLNVDFGVNVYGSQVRFKISGKNGTLAEYTSINVSHTVGDKLAFAISLDAINRQGAHYAIKNLNTNEVVVGDFGGGTVTGFFGGTYALGFALLANEGIIEQGHIVLKYINEAQALDLVNNPYQLLKPQIETFYYTAGSGTTHNLLANDVESSSEVTSPAITQVHALTATSVQSTSEVTTATLTQVHALLANDIESASEVTTPTLTEGTHNLLANDVESNSELTTPTLAQIHNFLATSVQSLSQVSSPTLTQSGIHVLTAVSIESVSILSRPLLLTRTLTEGDIMAIANAVFDKFVAEGFDVNQINTLLTAIDSATSQLTYSVSNQLDVNVKSLNDTTLNGTGTSEDKWRG